MARHFFRLKLALLRNGLRAGWQRVAGMAIGALVALPSSLLAAAALAAGRGGGADPAVPDPALVVVFFALAVAWVVGPLVAFGVDETLDPARLALLPLPRRRLVVGLVVASSVGVGPLATLVVLAGAVVRLAPLGPGAAVVVAGAAVQFAVCVVASRAATTALSGLLRSRRTRDATTVALALASASLGVAFQVAARLLPSLAGRDGALGGVARSLRWTPPGMAAWSMASAADGRTGAAVLQLAVAAAAVVALGWGWSVALDRLVTSPGPGPAARRREAPELFPRAWAFLPRTRTGAVAAKELRYAWREPRRRVALISTSVFAAAPVAGVLLSGGRRPTAVLAAAALAPLAGLAATNQVGADGPALWTNVAAGNDPRADLVGKNLAEALVALAVVAAAATGLAAATGGWAYAPAAVALGAGALGSALGVANVVSVRAPQPVPDAANLWGGASGQGCAAGLVQLVAMAVQGALVVPLVVAVGAALALWPPALALVATAALPYGFVLWRTGLRLAVDWAWWRQPELLEAVASGRTA